ncbi:MAG: hypothetical protein JWN93_633 [Hyphomicrobiales bacterium]|nr:hypothetical protein [Hyphomicrobiales bacterium]
MSLSHVARRIAEFPIALAITGYVLLSDLLAPVIAPLILTLSRLRVVIRAQERIERLGPYPSLALLACPIILLEPLKLGALVWIGFGHVVTGTALLIASHALSLLFVERLFAVVKPKLLSMRWFARLWFWFVDVRTHVLAWLTSTRAWSVALRVRDAARRLATRVRGWIRRRVPPR